MSWGSVISAGISAAGSLAGGLLSQQSTPGVDKDFAREMWKKNYDAQKEFAQQGIRWKVDDAKSAGLHPLAALGSSSFFSPSSMAGDMTSSAGYDASWLGDMGQSIGRGVEAKMTQEERAKAEAVNDEANQLKLENMRLQNESLKLDMASQLARDVSASQRAVRTTALPPAMPSLRTRSDGATVGSVMPGQGDATSSSLFTVKPAEIVANDPSRPSQEAASVAEVRWARTADGGYSPMRSQALEEALEDDTLGSLAWNIRNRIAPSLGDMHLPGSHPPDSYLPGGDSSRFGWTYNPWKQAYYPFRRGSLRDYAGKRLGW